MNAPQARQYIALSRLGWLYEGTAKDGTVTLVREEPEEEQDGNGKPGLQRISYDRNGFSRQDGVQ